MEQETEYQPDEKSKFNYATAILQRIDYLQFKATEHYRKGDLESWFYEWKAIKFQIIGKMEEKDEVDYKGKLRKIESKVAFLIDKSKQSDKYRKILISMIESYVDNIQTIIEKWGMGLINQKDETLFT